MSNACANPRTITLEVYELAFGYLIVSAGASS